MFRFLSSLPRQVRVWIPVLLALHLVAAQASMLPASHAVQAPLAAMPQAVPHHCHDEMPSTAEEPSAQAGKGSPATGQGGCDGARCYCPVAIVPLQCPVMIGGCLGYRVGLIADAQPRVTAGQAPDLRPPIAR